MFGGNYCAGKNQLLHWPKILLSFSVWSYGKTQTNFLTNHLLYLKMYMRVNRCRIEERHSELEQIYGKTAAAAAKSLQSCLTLCNPRDGSPPGSPIPGILQARTLVWVTISFSNAWKWKVKVKLLSRVWLLATPWTAAYQAPPSMGFSRQEYWSGVPLPSPSIKRVYINKNPATTIINSWPS